MLLRIDNSLLSDCLVDTVDKRNTVYNYNSDHSAVVLGIKLYITKSGPWLLKLNAPIIQDNSCLCMLKSKKKLYKYAELNKLVKWEFIKNKKKERNY